jgi:hypothetical protein
MVKERKTGGVVQVVECLPSKRKPLSSNPRTAQKKKVRKKKVKQKGKEGRKKPYLLFLVVENQLPHSSTMLSQQQWCQCIT